MSIKRKQTTFKIFYAEKEAFCIEIETGDDGCT